MSPHAAVLMLVAFLLQSNVTAFQLQSISHCTFTRNCWARRASACAPWRTCSALPATPRRISLELVMKVIVIVNWFFCCFGWKLPKLYSVTGDRPRGLDRERPNRDLIWQIHTTYQKYNREKASDNSPRPDHLWAFVSIYECARDTGTRQRVWKQRRRYIFTYTYIYIIYLQMQI